MRPACGLRTIELARQIRAVRQHRAVARKAGDEAPATTTLTIARSCTTCGNHGPACKTCDTGYSLWQPAIVITGQGDAQQGHLIS